MAFKLSIEQGKGRGQAFDFDAEQITIGRTEENDVVLYEQGVSRRHARIVRQGERYFLEDVESANGTLLNGAKVRRELLADGDRITIGDVVFRFGSGQAGAGDGSTRVIVASKDDRTAARGVVPAAPSAASAPAAAPLPAVQAVPFNPRNVVIAVSAALIVAILWAAWSGRSQAPDKSKCPSAPLVLDDVRSDVFGTTGESACRVGRTLKFGFRSEPRTRYIFSYSSFYTDRGTLQVLLNGKPVDESPLATTRRSVRHEVEFSENDVVPGVNVVTFNVVKGTDWGIENLDLLPVNLDKSSLADGELHFQRGEILYQQKNVAASNLYNAYLELRTARQFMEGLSPQPADLSADRDLLKDIEPELDRVCHEHMWVAHRDQIFRKFDQALDQYRFLLMAFPGDVHPCRAEALDAMGPQERHLVQRSPPAHGGTY